MAFKNSYIQLITANGIATALTQSSSISHQLHGKYSCPSIKLMLYALVQDLSLVRKYVQWSTSVLIKLKRPHISSTWYHCKCVSLCVHACYQEHRHANQGTMLLNFYNFSIEIRFLPYKSILLSPCGPPD